MSKQIIRATALFVVASGLALLGGCAIGNHHPLDPEAAASLQEVDAFVGIKQSEIDPPIVRSNGAGGQFGLIGALVESAMLNAQAEEYETQVRVLRDALIDYDFDTKMTAAVAQNLPAVDWVGESEPTLIQGELDSPYAEAIDQSESDAVVFMTPEYRMGQDFRNIELTMLVSAFPANSDLDQYRATGRKPYKNLSSTNLENAIYSNRFTVVVKTEMGSEEAAAHIYHWAEDDGKLAREGLDAAIARIARMAVVDMQQLQGSVMGEGGRETVEFENRTVRVAHEEDGVSFYRDSSGHLWSDVTVSP